MGSMIVLTMLRAVVAAVGWSFWDSARWEPCRPSPAKGAVVVAVPIAIHAERRPITNRAK